MTSKDKFKKQATYSKGVSTEQLPEPPNKKDAE
jgi:hypothetical protein